MIRDIKTGYIKKHTYLRAIEVLKGFLSPWYEIWRLICGWRQYPYNLNNTNYTQACPFCADVWKKGGTCANCLAPPLLCVEESRGGFIGLLLAKHWDVLLSHLSGDKFVLMRSSLVQLAQEGLAAACLRTVALPVAETVPPLGGKDLINPWRKL